MPPRSSNSVPRLFNLDSFMNQVTPSFHCHRSTSAIDEEEKQKQKKDDVEDEDEDEELFFCLSDVWSCFDEWSVYGAGVPLVLPCGQKIVQYYVPFLSALQIYRPPNLHLLRSSSMTTGSESESEWESLSDQLSSSSSSSASSSTTAASEQQLSMESRKIGIRGEEVVTAFEYMERCPPYLRTPLAPKIRELSLDFPQLYTLTTSELSPASWFSVAWYPIYRIPTGPTMSDLSTCFLTFHSLWMPPFTGVPTTKESMYMTSSTSSMSIFSNNFLHTHPKDSSSTVTSFSENYANACSMEPAATICLGNNRNKNELEQWLQDHSAWRFKQQGSVHLVELPAFGLAFFKLKGPFWDSAPEAKLRMNSLLNSADSWIRHMGVQHPDYDFFSSRQGFKAHA